MSKITIEVSKYRQEEVDRLIKNYHKIAKAGNMLKDINANGTWLLELQNKGIHTFIKQTEDMLDYYQGEIIKELSKMGGNLFVNKVLE